MGEIDNIKERYSRRAEMEVGWYSFFDPAYLHIMQECERVLLLLLKRNGITNLNSKKILDVGCGNGHLLRQMVNYGASIDNLYGVELLENRVKAARAISGNISIILGNAEELEFEDETFDLIFQSMMFSSIFDLGMKKRIAEEMLRVLKKEGLIISYDFFRNNPKNRDVMGVGKKEMNILFQGCNLEFRRTTLAPPIARAVAPYSKIMCLLLQKIPLLLTHYYVVVRKS